MTFVVRDLDWIPTGQAVEHPTENALWFWNRHDSSKTAGAARAPGDGRHPMSIGGAGRGRRLFGNTAGSWGLFYFDVDRKAPSVVAGLGFGPKFDLHAATWDGSQFEPRTFVAAIQANENHRMAYDPKRRVLIHFACTPDRATGLAETRVRECGVEDIWHDVPGVPTLAPAVACWDATRERVIVCDALKGGTWAWTGSEFLLVCEKPDVQWPKMWVSHEHHRAPLQRLFGAKHPMLVTMDDGLTDQPNREAGLWSLEAEGWKLHKANGLHYVESAIFDGEANEWLLLRADWGPMNAATIAAQVTADGAKRYGRVMVQAQCGVVGANHRFWGGPAHPITRDRELLRRYAAPVLYVHDEGIFRALEPQLEAASVGVVASGTALVSIEPSGVAHLLDEGGVWRAVAAEPKPPPREQTTLSNGPDGAVLLVGGAPHGGGRFLSDAWLLKNNTWQALKTKGKAPALIDAHAVYSPTLSRWVLLGGKDNKYQYSETTWEFDGKTWSQFPTYTSNETSKLNVALLAWDSDSGCTFIVASGSMYVYDGQGMWRLVGACTAEGVGAYDQNSRTVRFRSGRGLSTPPATFAMSNLLDEAKAAVAANVRSVPDAGRPLPAKPPVADAVWLRYVDDTSDKFWFAATTAAGWRAEWGRRGGAKSTKEYAFEAPERARADYQKKVQRKLAEGYEHAVEGASVALVAGRNAFGFDLGSRGADQFGGMPAGVPESNWPVCHDCKHPMPFVLMLHKHEARLPLQRHGALALFACNGSFSAGACQSWEADYGCNRVLLLGEAELRQPALTTAPVVNGLGAASPMAPRFLKYGKADFEADPVLEQNADKVDDASKVGGFPSWVQGDESPTCKQCTARMTFVAQLDERLDSALNFGGGMGYLFVCPDEHEARFLWQQ